MIESKLIEKQKYNSEGELIVFFFERCNLTCQFCPQDHESIVGLDNILGKTEIIKKALDTMVSKGKTSVSISYMGGELFEDRILDSTFDEYAIVIHEVNEYAKSINLPINCHLATHLVYNKRDRVLDFVKKVNLPLAASYDPSGRFNQQNLEIFKNNVEFFKDHILQIGVVMTKPNIAKFVKGEAPFFKYLYDNFTVVFDNYTFSQNTDHKKLMPNDVEYRDFYIFMVNNWPNCLPFSEMYTNLPNKMSCMQTMYIFPDSTFGSCGTFETGLSPLVDKTGKITRINISPLEKVVEKRWLNDYDCFSCEHMQRCTFSCFLNNHFKNNRTQEVCWLKEVYDHIDQKGMK
jgi:hypothetical protein